MCDNKLHQEHAGASQADVALIMVPCDGNFTSAIAKGNHKAGEIQGQTRQQLPRLTAWNGATRS